MREHQPIPLWTGPEGRRRTTRERAPMTGQRLAMGTATRTDFHPAPEKGRV